MIHYLINLEVGGDVMSEIKNNNFTHAMGYLDLPSDDGTNTRVEWAWNNGHFEVRTGVSFDNASLMLELLSARLSTLERFEVHKLQKAPEPPVTTPIEEVVEPPQTVVEKPKTKSKSKKKAKPPVVEEVVVEEPVVEEKVVAEKVVAEKVTEIISSNGDSGIPDELKDCRQLKKVVKYYLDRGLDAEAVLDKINTIREEVPVLKRATNLKKRVVRIAEVYRGAAGV